MLDVPFNRVNVAVYTAVDIRGFVADAIRSGAYPSLELLHVECPKNGSVEEGYTVVLGDLRTGKRHRYEVDIPSRMLIYLGS